MSLLLFTFKSRCVLYSAVDIRVNKEYKLYPPSIGTFQSNFVPLKWQHGLAIMNSMGL